MRTGAATRLGAALSLALLLAGCDGASTVNGQGATAAASPSGPRCATHQVELPEDVEGSPSRDAAFEEAFADSRLDLQLAENSRTLLLDGRPAGTVTFLRTASGGFVVLSAEYCYPEGVDPGDFVTTS